MLITLFCVKRLHPTQSYRTNPLFPYRTPFLSLSVAADVPLLIEPELCLDRLAQFHRARIGIARQRIGRTLRRGEGRARLLTRAERIFVRTQFDQRAPVGAGRLAGNIVSAAADPPLGHKGFGRVGHAAPFNGYAPQIHNIVQHVDSNTAPSYPRPNDGEPYPPT